MADQLFVIALTALFLSILLVFRFDLRGVLAGSIQSFGAFMIFRRIGESLDPSFHGNDCIIYTEKTVELLIFAIIFSLLTYGMKRIWLKMEAKVREQHKP